MPALGVESNNKNKLVKRLLSLTDCTHRLTRAGDRMTFHVLESMKVTDTVIVFARNNNLEHVARGVCTSATMQSIMGSVSAKGAPESPGRSTVVRARKQGARAVARASKSA